MIKSNHIPTKCISQGQLSKAEMMFADCWQRTWKIVKPQNFARHKSQEPNTFKPLLVNL
ncbi:MAG: hypothetical protein AAFQ80_06930 [Cyanobacteria bacterium J06621_8]